MTNEMNDTETTQPPPNHKRTLFINFLACFFFLFSGIAGGVLGYQSLKAQNVLVLTYHGVTATPFYPWEATEEHLASTVRSLRDYGYKPLTPDEFETWRSGGMPQGNGFLLTFDDGLQTSAAMMRKLRTNAGVPSLIFIITDMIGKPGYLNADEIRALASDGFGIGLHGKRHYEVTKILSEGGNLTDELVQARGVLESLTGRPVTWYAYPFGEYSDQARNAVASAGLRLAFTIDAIEQKRDQDPLKLPRLMYLKGAREAGEPTIDDWLPPPNIKAGYLHLGMAALVLFFGLQILVRSLRFALYLRRLRQEASQPASPPVQGTTS